MSDYVIEMLGITKQYPGVLANDHVDLQIRRGSVLCLVGENGAGKSTLMKILYGLEQPDSGEIRLNGEAVVFHSSRDAIRHRIGMVHQHFMLVGELSVLENIILGMEPTAGPRIDYKKARKELEELSRKFNMAIPLDAPAGSLPVGLQQKVEILKAMYRGADVLILDEPTAVLTPQETRELFTVIRDLAASGHSLILITHKLDEVMQVGDEIVVMRHGVRVASFATEETNASELAVAMVGSALPSLIEREEAGGKELLSLQDVTLRGPGGKPLLDQINITLHEGEILGIAGVSGNGQGELADVVTGILTADAGSIRYAGEDITHLKRGARLKKGIDYIPEDRSSRGLCLPWSIADNLIAGFQRRPDFLKRGLLNQSAILEKAKQLIADFDIRTPSATAPASTLSGGNQQKIVIARESSFGAKLIVAAEPTRGVDIGAISFIHNNLISLRNSGVAVLLFSSDLDEIFKLSDRIAVLYEGKIVFTAKAGTITREKIGLYMAGVGKDGPQ